MNAINVVLKILAAAVVVAGAVVVVIMYGDKIMGFIKKLMSRLGVCECGGECCESDFADEFDAEGEEVVAAEQDFEG